jgi:hypothetical protein
MYTKMPSEVVGSPSAVPVRLCRKNPYWLAPAAVRDKASWVTTPRT